MAIDGVQGGPEVVQKIDGHFLQSDAGFSTAQRFDHEYSQPVSSPLFFSPDKKHRMPQNTKDSQGGKTHPPKKTTTPRVEGDRAQAKKSTSNSPVGASKHGEKKTTP